MALIFTVILVSLLTLALPLVFTSRDPQAVRRTLSSVRSSSTSATASTFAEDGEAAMNSFASIPNSNDDPGSHSGVWRPSMVARTQMIDDELINLFRSSAAVINGPTTIDRKSNDDDNNSNVTATPGDQDLASLLFPDYTAALSQPLIYIKTYKTASSTLASVFHNHAILRNRGCALPPPNVGAFWHWQDAPVTDITRSLWRAGKALGMGSNGAVWPRLDMWVNHVRPVPRLFELIPQVEKTKAQLQGQRDQSFQLQSEMAHLSTTSRGSRSFSMVQEHDLTDAEENGVGYGPEDGSPTEIYQQRTDDGDTAHTTPQPDDAFSQRHEQKLHPQQHRQHRADNLPQNTHSDPFQQQSHSRRLLQSSSPSSSHSRLSSPPSPLPWGWIPDDRRFITSLREPAARWISGFGWHIHSIGLNARVSKSTTTTTNQRDSLPILDQVLQPEAVRDVSRRI